MHASKVAPPHDSSDQNPTWSSLEAIGSISSIRMRVASRLWCASRRTSSVIPSGFLSLIFSYCLRRYFRIAADIAATSSSGMSDSGARGALSSADIKVIAATSSVRNTKTVPMPASISVRPWSRSVCCINVPGRLPRIADYTVFASLGAHSLHTIAHTVVSRRWAKKFSIETN